MTRNKGIDLTKSIAILCVLFIHAGSAFYAFPVASSAWNTLLAYGSLVRAGVPLFLMCSGALLLNTEKKLSLKRLYTHNLPRILAAMVFWGYTYKLWHLYEQNAFSAPALWNAFKEVLFFNQEFHFYYLHIILLVYILLPVMRVLTASADQNTLKYALLLWFALGILYPTVIGFWPFTLFSGMTPQYLINMTYASVGYGLYGYDRRNLSPCDGNIHALHAYRRKNGRTPLRCNEIRFKSLFLPVSDAYVRNLPPCTSWILRSQLKPDLRRSAYGSYPR